MAEPTRVTLATATPGGGFPFFGDNAAAVINETDKSLHLVTRNTKGSTENIGLLNEGKVDIALVAGEPAYEAFQAIGQPKTSALIIQANCSSFWMMACSRSALVGSASSTSSCTRRIVATAASMRVVIRSAVSMVSTSPPGNCSRVVVADTTPERPSGVA